MTNRKTIRAACAIIARGQDLLVGKRALGSMAGKWELVGGKIENTETPAEAIVRELKEELGVNAFVVSEMESYEHKYEDFDLTLFPILCQLQDVREITQLTDHSEIKWVPLSEILSMDFVEADYRALRDYISKQGGESQETKHA